MKVTCIVPYPLGLAPGQRFRVEQWLRLLEPRAVEAEFKPLLTSRVYNRLYDQGGFLQKSVDTIVGLAHRVGDVVGGSRADVVILYREAFPFGPAVLETVLERRVPVVYDFDDAIFLKDSSAANAWTARFKRPDKVGQIIREAAVTTVCNDFLASYAAQHSPRVRILPTTLDVDEYHPKPQPRRAAVRIGWSGSPTTSRHLRTIEGALRRVAERHRVELVAIGDKNLKLSVPGRQQVREWRKETEIDDVAAFDIGVMPLPDDDWARGKCGFKALLYMALGVPTVASPIGVNPEIIEDGVNGLLAASEDEWVTAIERLILDEELRHDLAASGRATVEERYSGQVWAPRFLDVLEEATARGTAA